MSTPPTARPSPCASADAAAWYHDASLATALEGMKASTKRGAAASDAAIHANCRRESPVSRLKTAEASDIRRGHANASKRKVTAAAARAECAARVASSGCLARFNASPKSQCSDRPITSVRPLAIPSPRLAARRADSAQARFTLLREA